MVPTLVYGCEAWELKEGDKMRLQVMEIEVLRRVAGVIMLEVKR